MAVPPSHLASHPSDSKLLTPQMSLPPSVMQQIHEVLPLVQRHGGIKVDAECCHLMNSMQALCVQCTSAAPSVQCMCTVIARYPPHDEQAPRRETDEALVYATKQARLGPGPGHVARHTDRIVKRDGSVLHGALLDRWRRTTASRGTQTTAPSTRYAQNAKQLPTPSRGPKPDPQPHPHLHSHPRALTLIPSPTLTGIHTAPLSQARFLEFPRRAWNECSLAARSLVVTAAPLFAILVAVK